MGDEASFRPPVVQQHGGRLHERGRLHAIPQAQGDGRGRAGRRHQHRPTEAKLHEAVDMAAQDALDSWKARHDGR